MALSRSVSLSVYVVVCTHMMTAHCASAWLLHLIAPSSSTLGNVNGGQLTSDTVHLHLYSTHHHPDGNMVWEKKNQAAERFNKGGLGEAEEKHPLLYWCSLLNRISVCLYLFVLSACAQDPCLCDWRVHWCVEHLHGCVDMVWSTQTGLHFRPMSSSRM